MVDIAIGFKRTRGTGPQFRRWIRLCGLLLVFHALFSIRASGEPLRLGTNVWPGYEPLYLARELGLLDESVVKLIQFRSATQVMHALQTGSIEACALTLDEVVTVTCSGTPMTLVLALDQSYGGDCVIAQPQFKQFADLKGKKIAVENTALGAFVLLRALDVAGMTLQDVQPVRLDVARHMNAFKESEVAASVCFEPTRSMLLEAGGSEIFNSREIPGEIVDVLAVRTATMTEFIAAFAHIGDAWDQALAYIAQEPDSAYAILGRRMGLDQAKTRAAYDGVRLLDRASSLELLTSASFQEGTLPRLVTFMLDQGLVEQTALPAINTDLSGVSGAE